MAIPPPHSLQEDAEYRKEALDYGTPGVLRLIPDFSAGAIGDEANRIMRRYTDRDAAFARWDRLLASVDENKMAGLESMVSNDARTMFALSVFLTASAEPRHTVAIGSQGITAARRANTSERALTSWWSQVDEQRILSGQEPFRNALAYWLCLYGWYAVQFAATEHKGEMVPVAVALNPAECYPVFADGLERFVHRYSTTAGEVYRMAIRLGGTPPPIKDIGKSVTVVDWYWRSPENDVVRAIVVSGLGSGWRFVLPPGHLSMSRIPIIVGRVSGSPSLDSAETGSVLYENELVYRDFHKWLSFFLTITKEHARAPILAHNIKIEEKQVSPTDIRSGAAILETDDPEARLERLAVGGGVYEVTTIISLISEMLQRGGFPYLVYGGLGRELSGFAISQLLQAAERRIGPQVRRLALIDSIISQHWLEQFRDGTFEPSMLSGALEGNPRKAFLEDFAPKDVPKKFKVITEIPIRVGNDLMARMAIARQAVGGAAPLLDLTTVLDEILQMQDPTLIVDRIAADAASRLALPFKAALKLKLEAADLKDKYGSGAADVVRLLETLAETIIQQSAAQTGAQPRQRVSPQNLPPEALGVSPDVVRAARQEGPANA